MTVLLFLVAPHSGLPFGALDSHRFAFAHRGLGRWRPRGAISRPGEIRVSLGIGATAFGVAFGCWGIPQFPAVTGGYSRYCTFGAGLGKLGDGLGGDLLNHPDVQRALWVGDGEVPECVDYSADLIAFGLVGLFGDEGPRA
jgi:hypothetical protein